MAFDHSGGGEAPLAWRAAGAEREAGIGSGGSGGGSEHKRRVLVVEDDVETADFIVSLLENADYEVEVATDGQYCLYLLNEFEPELILMDTSLPGVSSYEVTQVLRNAPQYGARFRYTRIIYMSEQRQIIGQRFHSQPDAPMSDYMFKPIDASTLLERVERTLEEIDSNAEI